MDQVTSIQPGDTGIPELRSIQPLKELTNLGIVSFPHVADNYMQNYESISVGKPPMSSSCVPWAQVPKFSAQVPMFSEC